MKHHHHPGILWDDWQIVLDHDDDCDIGPLDDYYHEACYLDHDDHAYDDGQFADYNVHVTDAQIDRGGRR